MVKKVKVEKKKRSMYPPEPKIPVERWTYETTFKMKEIDKPPDPHPCPDELKRVKPDEILAALRDCYGKPHTAMRTCGWWCFHVVVPPSTTKHVSDRFVSHFFSPMGRGIFEMRKMCLRRLEKVNKAVYDHCIGLIEYFYKIGYLEDDKWGNEKPYSGYSRVLTFSFLDDIPEARGLPLHIDRSAVYQYGTPILSYNGCKIIEDYDNPVVTEVQHFFFFFFFILFFV